MANVCITFDTEGDSANNPYSTFFGISIVLPSLIHLLNKYELKATFFIQEDKICQIGSNFSKLWKSLENDGHEIAYHAHGLIRAPIEEKRDIITKGINKLRNLGLHPISFRGGRYHFNASLLKILEENNIKYDSSVVPGLRECHKDGTVRCEHVGAPYKPYFPSYENHRQEGNSKILELPINRYPKLSSNILEGVLTGGVLYAEILFDYFYDIKKDKLIIVCVHTWEGLSYIIKRIVLKEKYGKIKRFFFEFMRKIVGSNFLIDSRYIKRFDNFLRYISGKNNVHFTTIREAGGKFSIIKGKLHL